MARETLKIWAEATFIVVLSIAAVITVGFMLANTGLVLNAIPIAIITLLISAFGVYEAYRLIRYIFKGR
jgi:hypothetical protein